MHSFLGVPVRVRDEVFGRLYLTEKKNGEQFTDVEKYITHVLASLPEAYRASIDVKHWADLQRAVVAGTTPLKEAMASMPRLARQAGGCPCGKSVRWVID